MAAPHVIKCEDNCGNPMCPFTLTLLTLAKSDDEGLFCDVSAEDAQTALKLLPKDFYGYAYISKMITRTPKAFLLQFCADARQAPPYNGEKRWFEVRNKLKKQLDTLAGGFVHALKKPDDELGSIINLAVLKQYLSDNGIAEFGTEQLMIYMHHIKMWNMQMLWPAHFERIPKMESLDKARAALDGPITWNVLS